MMRRAWRCALFVLAFACRALFADSPATIHNDDSCEIGVVPAATLLLPYFEADLANPATETTLFTVTNVGALPQIARVTIWTDRAFPVFTFNFFLTGYDQQTINLGDLIARGRIVEPGTSSDSEVGFRSAENDENPLLDITACGDLIDHVPPQILTEIQRALTAGRTTACTTQIGNVHPRAIGYVTIDVVRNCGPATPIDAGYFSAEILYDNVLIGDYQQVSSAQNFAQGNTLVHIRAIPEGGLSGSARTNFRRTFYSRLQNGGTADRRQPLPSTFAARWISGGAGELKTSVKVWREGATSAAAGCAVSSILARGLPDFVRFDEEENATLAYYGCNFTCPEPFWDRPAVARFSIDDSGVDLPPNPGGDLAGWMYYNLDYFLYGQSTGDSATQSWVVVSMAAEGRFSVDLDATRLGNGCSERPPYTAEDGGEPAIGPAPDITPR
jgi:hypothetical protein